LRVSNGSPSQVTEFRAGARKCPRHGCGESQRKPGLSLQAERL
jgi:hypothetical protein